jgi:hypothetical protein
MLVSVIIVNYNTGNLVEDCIASVGGSLPGGEAEVIVVDNGSTDKSVIALKRSHPEATIISNPDNRGFARANNQGYEISKGRYILLLNPDTIARNGAVGKLVRFLAEHPDVAIIGPRLLNENLTLQLPCRRSFPNLWNSMAYFSGLSRMFPKSKVFGGYHLTYLDATVNHEVDAVSGACMLIRRDVVEQIGGLLDEAYFMHFEDLDLCFRAKKRGYKVVYVHDAEVIHLKGRSSKFRRAGVSSDFFDSAQVYFRRNYRDRSRWGYYLMQGSVVCMSWVVRCLHGGRKKIARSLHG